MKAIELRLALERFQRDCGKTSFTVTELANVAGARASRRALQVQLTRLVMRGVISRYARGRYGLPGATTPEALLPALDSGAYLTGAHALYRHGIVTQAPTALTCMTDRRHNRSRVRDTAAGRLVFVCVKRPIYSPPPRGVLADPEQALCDFVYLMRRAGVDPETVVTFRNLHRLRQSRLRRLTRNYPSTVAVGIGNLLQRPAAGAK